MAPRHTQECGKGGISGDGTSLVPNTPKVVGFFFPPPACAGICPTLFPFRFRGFRFSLGSRRKPPRASEGLEGLQAFLRASSTPARASEGLQGLTRSCEGPSKTSEKKSIQGPARPPWASEGSEGLQNLRRRPYLSSGRPLTSGGLASSPQTDAQVCQ